MACNEEAKQHKSYDEKVKERIDALLGFALVVVTTIKYVYIDMNVYMRVYMLRV